MYFIYYFLDYVIVTELESAKSAKPNIAPSSTSSRRASFTGQPNSNVSPQLNAISVGASHYIKNNLPGFGVSNMLMSSYKELFELLGIWYKQAIFVLELANQIYSNNSMSSVNNSPAASQFLSSEYSQTNSLLASKERSFLLHLHSCHICELILYMIQQWASYHNIQLSASNSNSITSSPQISAIRHPFTSPLGSIPNSMPSSSNVSPALKPLAPPQIGTNELKQVIQFQTIISQLFNDTLKKCDQLSNFLTRYQSNATEGSSVFEQKSDEIVESATQIIYNYSIRMV